jgi:hypothetical protein
MTSIADKSKINKQSKKGNMKDIKKKKQCTTEGRRGK